MDGKLFVNELQDQLWEVIKDGLVTKAIVDPEYADRAEAEVAVNFTGIVGCALHACSMRIQALHDRAQARYAALEREQREATPTQRITRFIGY